MGRPEAVTTAGTRGRRERLIYDGRMQQRLSARICDWHQMVPDEVVAGPAVVEHPTTTVYVDPRHEVVSDQVGNLVITRRGES
jgi:N-methylhydantoinase A/oxoprolinase/acetone carboxylase beta subunit